MEIKLPGANGAWGKDGAALFTAPGVTAGISALACSVPVYVKAPRICGASCSALAVTAIFAARTFPPYQVPCQRPSLSEASASGGSPLEKVVSSRPDVWGVPQSSTARTSSGIGQAAGAV